MFTKKKKNEHFQGFTILRQDPVVGGLEVKLPSTDHWIPVSCDVENSFVVNSGDLIQHWTNGLWRSNLHRVVNPGPSDAHLSRLSMVFFTGPNEKTFVEPLECCVQLTGGEALYPSVTASEHLHMKLQKSNTK
ncbi:2OG-Fe(II) oxygenase superfamily domain-containing protein [Ditylenchus destructor]|uniref:2OG-Fe(II) oxygenase superfamily domain-containing protein n=1 Tax=Ditylenchus destructor TaxID=166010 RepID=A0AAD4MRG2_9BILA|nr:2OG-Fe(II) oxygenase superfamily domain-containing protein [Ditylenchus destructor]